MRYSHEKLVDTLSTVDGLINAYWFATKENAGHEALDFAWLRYCEMESVEMLHLYTARTDSGDMVGAAIYIITEHPHHKGYVMALCDTLCTAIAVRGLGIARGLMAYAEPRLVAVGVREIVHMQRLVYGVEPLFPKLGYSPFETAYSKKVS